MPNPPRQQPTYDLSNVGRLPDRMLKKMAAGEEPSESERVLWDAEMQLRMAELRESRLRMRAGWKPK